MKPRICFLVMLLSLGAFETASAEGWLQRWLPSSWQQQQNVDTNGCRRTCGPDDYCRKPFPCLLPLCPNSGCDDYCRKPFPCLAPPDSCCGPNDFCRKPLPCLLYPISFPYVNFVNIPGACERPACPR